MNDKSKLYPVDFIKLTLTNGTPTWVNLNVIERITPDKNFNWINFLNGTCITVLESVEEILTNKSLPESSS